MARSTAPSVARAVAVYTVLARMSTLPAELNLYCLSSFVELDQLLVATILEDRLLRTLFIHFIRNGEEVVHVSATIDWRRKTFTTEGTDDDEMIDVDDYQDFEAALVRKLNVFRANVGKLARAHRADSAQWAVVLIDEGGKKARSDIIRRRFRVIEDTNYTARIKRFDDALRSDGGVRGGFGDKRVSGLGLLVRSRRL